MTTLQLVKELLKFNPYHEVELTPLEEGSKESFQDQKVISLEEIKEAKKIYIRYAKATEENKRWK